jgi:AcrR family transcriptional regulator
MTEHVESPPAQKRDREQTEHRIVQAALDLLQRDGVLAGLSLQDVAEQAGVGRGNIYNYFGTRRELLRQALRIRYLELGERLGSPVPAFVDRKLRFVGGPSENLYGTDVLSLLVLDGDDDIVPMPFFEEAMTGMRSSVEVGDIHPDHADDLEALHIAISATTRGYNLLRAAYANQLDVTIDELDERIRKVMGHWLAQMAKPTEPQPTESLSEEPLSDEQLSEENST